MNTTTRSNKGKRGRNSMDDFGVPAKRSRARRGQRAVEVAGNNKVESPPPTKSRHGLLTPEASGSLESQTESPIIEEKVAPRDKDIFPFLELPAEIRLHIYYMALVRPEPILLHAERVPEKVVDEPTKPISKVEESEEEANNGALSGSSSTSSSPSTSSTVGPTTRARLLRENFARHPSNSAAADPPPINTTATSSHHPDPIVPVLLRLNKQINKEAWQILYAENVFTLSLSSGIHTLSSLHQRSRSLIKHVTLTIPSHHDILDGFADLVRLGLRYCWTLKTFRIILDASLPDATSTSPTASTSVYANAFHILRWLPRGCSVVLEGSVGEQVRRVVHEEGRLMNVLDERSYLKRQHQMPERH